MDNSNNPNWPNNPFSSTPPPPPPPPITPQMPPLTNPWDQPSQLPPSAQSPDTTSSSGPVELQNLGGGQAPSPLDNPWGNPAQTPATNSQSIPITPTTESSPQPTWMPTAPQPTNLPEPTPLPQTPPSPPPVQSEPAPTDLSHLITNNSQTPETLVVPPISPEVTTTLPVDNHKDFPKWLIGVGVGLLILVTGASAYFILGIGQPPKTTSIPASEEQTTTLKNPPPIASPVSQPTPPTTSGSANFGQLEGSGNTTPQATSAADLLRQR